MALIRKPPSIPTAISRRGLSRILLRMIKLINKTQMLGFGAALLGLAILLVGQWLVILLRYSLSDALVTLQDGLQYGFVLVIFMGLGFTLRIDRHVRIDLVGQHMNRISRNFRDWLDIATMSLCLLPFCFMVFVFYWPYLVRAWHFGEQSREVAGLPFVFLVKTVPLIGLGLLVLQAIALIMRCVVRISLRNSPMTNTANTANMVR